MIPYSDTKKNKYKPGLYVVSTPIGNLNDITLRAVYVLGLSEYILCEDTRVAKKLLTKFNIKSKLISNHKFNEKKNSKKIIELLKLNKIISIISDAGTPSISDPGKIIINECIENNIPIIPIPGASASITATSISGFSEKYMFYGFFPSKKKTISKDLTSISKIDCAVVFFVSPKKINKNIVEIKKYFSGRKILICREISKLYEEFIRTTVDELQPFLKIPRGEFTVVISESLEDKNMSKKLDESAKLKIKKMIKTNSVKDIVNLICSESEIPKKIIYNYCLSLKR